MFIYRIWILPYRILDLDFPSRIRNNELTISFSLFNPKHIVTQHSQYDPICQSRIRIFSSRIPGPEKHTGSRIWIDRTTFPGWHVGSPPFLNAGVRGKKILSFKHFFRTNNNAPTWGLVTGLIGPPLCWDCERSAGSYLGTGVRSAFSMLGVREERRAGSSSANSSSIQRIRQPVKEQSDVPMNT
jgi:hypothetical protein